MRSSILLYTYTVLEFACKTDSQIGISGYKLGFDVHRLSLDIADLTIKKGLLIDLELVKNNPGASLHGSLPCTPWSTWNRLNLHKLGFSVPKKLEQSREISLIMLKHFILSQTK